MIRLTSYSSEDSLIIRGLRQCRKSSPKRFLKYVTTNEYENILVLENVTFNPNLVKILYTKLRRNLCNGRCLSIDNNISANQKSDTFGVYTQMRKEYYNDIDICLKDYGQLDKKKADDVKVDEAALSTTYEDHLDSTTSPGCNHEYESAEINTKCGDVLSSNESTIFLDAIDVDYDTKAQHDSDDDTMKSITKTSTSRISLESIALPQSDELSQEENVAVSDTKSSRTMTVMTKDVLNDGDWGKEREVVVLRDENKSFGISIVGGKVNVSDDTVVSGIFIKNIIPNSPADNCGLLKIGDRILAVDGIDISQSSHEHAVKTIKNADSKMILQVQSLVKKIDDSTETSTLLKKIPPPITPCKTPELELIHEGNDVTINVIKEQDNTEQESSTDNINTDTIKLPIPVDSVSSEQPDTESDNSSDDEDVREMEGKTYTKAGVEIDRASAGNIKRTKEEVALDTEEEDSFGYTAKKIKKRYGALGQVLHHSVERSSGGALGISLAGHRDRTKMACFIAGINPKGSAAGVPFAIGDEILEVNGLVLHGRSHLNVPTIIKGLVGPSIKFIVLRRASATEDLAVKPVTQFPVCIDEEEEMFSAYKNVRVVSIKKGSSGLGIMIIEGKHAEVGQGIFISDIQEGSMADKAGLNIGEMILSVNKDSLIGCNYETAASLLKKTEGVVTLKICNPNKTNDTDANTNTLDPNVSTGASGKKSPTPAADAKSPSRPVTPKPQASPAKEAVDPSKAEIEKNENTIIEINAEKNPLGIWVAGGCDTLINTGAVIVDIIPNSVANKDKRLQVFDQILEINGIKITPELSEKQIQKAVKQMVPKVRMVVFRPNTAETENVEVELVKKPGKLLGVGFRANNPNGIVVTDMLPGGIAESDGRLLKGDIISTVNAESISNMSFEDCSTLLKTAQGKITFNILRPKPKTRLL